MSFAERVSAGQARLGSLWTLQGHPDQTLSSHWNILSWAHMEVSQRSVVSRLSDFKLPKLVIGVWGTLADAEALTSGNTQPKMIL